MNKPDQNSTEPDRAIVSEISQEIGLQFEQRLKRETEFKKAEAENEYRRAEMQRYREKSPRSYEHLKLQPKLRIHIILLDKLSCFLRKMFK